MQRLLSWKMACLLIIVAAGEWMPSPARAQADLVPSRGDVAGARPQPDYAPVNLQFGPVIAAPALRIEQGYDSNIFGLPVDPQGAPYLVVTPSLDVSSDWGRHGYDLSSHVTLSRYANYSTQNTDEYGFHTGGHLDLDDITTSASVNLSRLAERRRENGTPLTFGQPSLVDTASELLQIQRNTGDIAVSARGSAQQIRYSDIERIDGTTESQAFRDLHVWTLEASASVSPTKVTGFSLAASYSRASSTAPGGQANQAFKLRANATVDLGMARLEAEVAYLNHQFDNPLYQPFQGLTFRGEAAWYPTPLLTVKGSASRSLEPSGDPASGAILTTSWRLGADYELLRNLVFRFETSQRVQRFRETGTNTDTRIIGVKGEYSFNHSVAFDAYARSECRGSTGAQAVVGRRWCAATVGVAMSLRR